MSALRGYQAGLRDGQDPRVPSAEPGRRTGSGRQASLVSTESRHAGPGNATGTDAFARGEDRVCLRVLTIVARDGQDPRVPSAEPGRRTGHGRQASLVSTESRHAGPGNAAGTDAFARREDRVCLRVLTIVARDGQDPRVPSAEPGRRTGSGRQASLVSTESRHAGPGNAAGTDAFARGEDRVCLRVLTIVARDGQDPRVPSAEPGRRTGHGRQASLVSTESRHAGPGNAAGTDAFARREDRVCLRVLTIVARDGQDPRVPSAEPGRRTGHGRQASLVSTESRHAGPGNAAGTDAFARREDRVCLRVLTIVARDGQDPRVPSAEPGRRTGHGRQASLVSTESRHAGPGNAAGTDAFARREDRVCLRVLTIVARDGQDPRVPSAEPGRRTGHGRQASLVSTESRHAGPGNAAGTDAFARREDRVCLRVLTIVARDGQDPRVPSAEPGRRTGHGRQASLVSTESRHAGPGNAAGTDAFARGEDRVCLRVLTIVARDGQDPRVPSAEPGRRTGHGRQASLVSTESRHAGPGNAAGTDAFARREDRVCLRVLTIVARDGQDPRVPSAEPGRRTGHGRQASLVSTESRHAGPGNAAGTDAFARGEDRVCLRVLTIVARDGQDPRVPSAEPGRRTGHGRQASLVSTESRHAGPGNAAGTDAFARREDRVCLRVLTIVARDGQDPRVPSAEPGRRTGSGRQASLVSTESRHAGPGNATGTDAFARGEDRVCLRVLTIVARDGKDPPRPFRGAWQANGTRQGGKPGIHGEPTRRPG